MEVSNKDKILRLRLLGKSYAEIAKELNIAKSTISYWLSRDDLSRQLNAEMLADYAPRNRERLALGREVNMRKWDAWREAARQEAIGEFDSFITDPLFTAGLMLYWGEGDSNPKNPLRLSNTTPGLIACYVMFLRKFLRLPKEKIKVGLVLYPDIEDDKARAYWRGITGLGDDNFHKSQYIKGAHPTKRLSNGVCMVAVSSRQKKVKVQEWIEIFSKRYYNTETDSIAGIV